MKIELVENIENSPKVLADAFEGDLKQIVAGLAAWGKRVSIAYLCQLKAPPDSVSRRSFLEQMKIFLAGLADAGRWAGIELILNDLEIFVRALRQFYGHGFRQLSEREQRLAVAKIWANADALGVA